MTFRIIDRCSTTTTSTGTGAIACNASAAAGYNSLSSLAVGDTFPYSIGEAGAAEWECGIGTVTAANTFTRTPTSSSNNNALVNFSAGTKAVMCVPLGATLTKCENGTSIRVVHTSAFCTSDSTLGMTPTTGADQTAKLQAILDLATAGPLVVIWDGAYSVLCPSGSLSALRIRSNTTIKALPGCGAVNLAATASCMFMNFNPVIAPTVAVDENISIEGGIWHGNADSVSSGASLMYFAGVNGLSLREGAELRKPNAIAWGATNSTHIKLDKFRIVHEAGNTTIHTDGLHFNGPVRYVDITNAVILNCADDSIAFNADDAWGAAVFTGPLDNAYGDILDVTVDNIYLQSVVCGIRLLSGGSRIDRVSISNIKGKAGGYWMIADNFIPAQTILTGPGNIGSVSIDNVCMENVPFGSWPKMQAHFNCKIEQLSIRNVTKSKFNNELYPAIQTGEKADIGQLHIDGFKSFSFNGGTYLAAQILFVGGSKVSKFKLTSSQFDAATAVAGSPIIVQAGATIGQATLVGNTGTNFTSFIENSGTITHLHAPAELNFMDALVVAAPAETTAPTITAASVANASPTIVTLSASEALDGSFDPAASAFTVSGHTVQSVDVTGSNINLTVTPAFVNGEAARTAAYVQPATNGARDIAGNLMASFSDRAITNNVAAAGASTWRTLPAGYVEQSASALTYTGPIAEIRPAYKVGVDDFAANVQTSCRIRLTGATSGGTANLAAGLILRGAAGVGAWDSTTTSYFMEARAAGPSAGFRIALKAGNSEIGIAAAIGTVAVGVDYDITFAAKNDLLTAKVQRVSDGFWLQTNGTFAATAATGLSGTNGSLGPSSGLGYGVYSHAGNTDGTTVSGVAFSNFATTAAP